MSFFVAGNWKTHLLSDEVNTLTQQLVDQCNQDGVAVFPPALYVPQVSGQLRDSAIGFGVQDISEGGFGATTGDLCAQQVVEFGCQYVLVGHSERRQRQQESSQWVAEKALAAVSAGLVPIVCVGETLDEREAGNDVETVMAQLEPVLNRVPVDSTLMVAYEPVWAIG
ncbi:MAG: triose-phosphate isomerase, partial [Pseudomonadales bacterium]